MTDPEPKRDYERVREQLIERGYLQSRIERFVLVDWTADRFQGRPRWKRSALKAALLAAPFLSAILAAVVARSQSPLLATTDWALLWLYLTPLSVFVLALMNLAVGAVSGVAARRFGGAGSSGARAGLLIGLPILIYLTLMMRSRGEGGQQATEWALLALVVVTVVFVSWLAGLVSISSMLGRRGALSEARGRSFWTVTIVVVVATLTLFAWRQVATTVDDSVAEWPAFEIQPRAPLVVVGVDGLGAGWVEQWGEEGALPNLLERMEAGVVIPFGRRPNAAPPEVWTTVLSGRDAESHGLRAVHGERLPGIKTTLQTDSASTLSLSAALRLLLPGRAAPVSASDRRVRTAWEVVGRERPTLAVGWWGSWPALEEPQADRSPWVLSDRLLAKLLSEAELDRDVWPPQLFDRMRDNFADQQRSLRTEFDSWRPPSIDDRLAEWLWASFQIDQFNLEAFQDLWQSGEFEVGFLYLPGLDILRHRVERGAGASLSALERATALRSYTVWLDRRLAAVGDGGERAGTVALIGDPGRATDAPLEGFVSLTGGDLPARCVEAPISARSIAALLLGLSGLPSAADMPAFQPRGCFDSFESHPQTVDSYGRRDALVESAPSEFDAEMVERLRSLGYLN